MSGAPTESFHRLPTSVIPKHYTIKLEPNLETFSFVGQETIDILIEKETSAVLLNAADLSITSAVWESDESVKQIASSISLDNETEVLTVAFEPPLPPAGGNLSFEFSGVLNDKLKGFYRSKYQGPNGEERYNAVTQFEATDARRCFPSWDEPAIRASFDITLVAPKDKVALSNMPVKNVTPHATNDQLLVYEYERTPIMSTYLIAFVVGEFDYVEDRTSDGTLCRVYTAAGKKEQGRFALDVAVRVLPYYKDYFGIAYPLPKMDLIAIADFSIGAMENWGLVTYRETCLLVDPDHSSAACRQRVALVVGHELAHQWFGNLVAIEWWTHLWLKEGYASFVEFLCVDHLFPEYDIWTQFVTDTRISALELDALESSHPIEVPVGHPSEIEEIFDLISYQKGASIIRMLHNYVGVEDFKKGMNLYLCRHQYANAGTEHLWKALADAGNKPVGDVMSTWTKQMGFPLITVTKSEQQGKNRVITLTQAKFVLSPNLHKSSQSYQWLVPLTFALAKDPNTVVHEILMDKSTVQVTIPDVEEADWVKINPGEVGYYRVRYTPEMLKQLIPAIREKCLAPVDRLGVLDDLFTLVKSGQSNTVEVLQLLEAYIEEDNYTVWSSIDNIFSKLRLLLDSTDLVDALNAYGRRIFSRIAEKISWDRQDNETHVDALLRTLVLNRMISFGDQKTIDQARSRFADHTGGKAVLHADLRKAAYRAVLSSCDEKTFQLLLTMYKEANLQEEKSRISQSLGTVKDVNLIKKVLDFAISEDVRSQDSIFVIIFAGLSKDGRNLVWEFFTERVEFFKKRYISSNMIARLVKNVLENFVTTEKSEEIENFFVANPYPGTERSVQQACESIRLNDAWLRRDLEQIKSFLSTQV